jgi:hypothetical protein
MAREDDEHGSRGSESEPPPLLQSWRNLYVFVLLELAFLVAAFWALTRWAS